MFESSSVHPLRAVEPSHLQSQSHSSTSTLLKYIPVCFRNMADLQVVANLPDTLSIWNSGNDPLLDLSNFLGIIAASTSLFDPLPSDLRNLEVPYAFLEGFASQLMLMAMKSFLKHVPKSQQKKNKKNKSYPTCNPTCLTSPQKPLSNHSGIIYILDFAGVTNPDVDIFADEKDDFGEDEDEEGVEVQAEEGQDEEIDQTRDEEVLPLGDKFDGQGIYHYTSGPKETAHQTILNTMAAVLSNQWHHANATESHNSTSADRFILPKGMSKKQALTRARLAYTAQTILDQVEHHPFLKQSQATLDALDAADFDSLKSLLYMRKYRFHLPQSVADVSEKDMDRLCRAHDNLNNNSYRVIKRASAFLERRATMEIHRSRLAEFGFPECESYWGVLSQKSRDYIKDLAKSEWACLHNRNVFVSEIDAVLDSLKTERKATTKSSQRKADLQASKRSQRRSDMKMDLKSL
ncbi:hypothetical protein HDU80_011813 [Chytriomyces hyalinus]|nr:hypothetical protein HDU80_011813 [Chytriomyces hyalinus]